MSITAALYDQFSIRVSAEDILKLNSCNSIEQIITTYTENDFPDSLSVETSPIQDTKIPNNSELLPEQKFKKFRNLVPFWY
ncbi:MAG: hypothetical protein V7K89_05680 [Nostoc sp.]|uniref:hypothetical protein n=1 Tax=Nostoc sp. TaxID=1180 RepID=UPI002FF4FD95